jgi:D-aminopeptidase
MIAWERHVDATRDDPGSLYQRLAAPVQFATGARAGYGFGLGRRAALGRAATGHGGALRGWRSQRLYVPSERISVVVLLNHLSEAHETAAELFAAAVGEDRPARPEQGPKPDWLGAYVEPETGISVRIEMAPSGQARLRYGHGAELLDINADGTAGADDTRLRPEEGGLRMDLPGDNQSSVLRACAPPDGSLDVAGRYRCGELDAELTVADSGGALYGGFSGRLGQGRMELLEPIGADVWAQPCARALDHTPPGDWTLVFKRDSGGRPTEVQIGCWLARGLTYERVGG